MILKNLYFAISFWLCSPALFAQLLTVELPNELYESSALEWASDSTFFTINDSGNDPELFEFDQKGNILQVWDLEDWGCKNEDWEALARDDEFLYVADFGNNRNTRRNLRIYKLSLADLRSPAQKGRAEILEIIPTEQHDFPPQESSLQYDFESLYSDGDQLVFFSKNRTEPDNGWARIYRTSKQPGRHLCTARDSVYMAGPHRFQTWVTGADYLPELNQSLTVSGSRMHLYVPTIHGLLDFSSFVPATQKEAVVFDGPRSFWCTDEQNNYSSGKLYKFDLGWMQDALVAARKEPAKVLNQRLLRGEKFIVRVACLFNDQVPIRMESSSGQLVYESQYDMVYYPRNLGEAENVLQMKTFTIPTDQLSSGTYFLEVEHPLGIHCATLELR